MFKTTINKTQTFFTRSRKMNYATLLIAMCAYSAAMFYLGTMSVSHVQAASVTIIKTQTSK